MTSIIAGGLSGKDFLGAGFAALLCWFLLRMWFYRTNRVAQKCTADFEAPLNDDGLGAIFDALERLVDEGDLVFLARQPGYTPAIGEHLRRQRARIFRLYLRELAWHLARIHKQARALAAAGDAEQASLIGRLIRQRLAFWSAIARIEIGLTAGALGVRRAARLQSRAVRDIVAAFASAAPRRAAQAA